MHIMKTKQVMNYMQTAKCLNFFKYSNLMMKESYNESLCDRLIN